MNKHLGTDRTRPQRTWAIPSDAPARHAVEPLLCGADDTARRWPWSRLTCHGGTAVGTMMENNLHLPSGYLWWFNGDLMDFYGNLWWFHWDLLVISWDLPSGYD